MRFTAPCGFLLLPPFFVVPVVLKFFSDALLDFSAFVLRMQVFTYARYALERQRNSKHNSVYYHRQQRRKNYQRNQAQNRIQQFFTVRRHTTASAYAARLVGRIATSRLLVIYYAKIVRYSVRNEFQPQYRYVANERGICRRCARRTAA